MKINESTDVKLDLKTIATVIIITASFVGMYFTLQADIEEAKKLPPNEINRIEYDLNKKALEKEIDDLSDRVTDAEDLVETMFRLGLELDKELHKIDASYDSHMDQKIKEIENQIKNKSNKKRKNR